MSRKMTIDEIYLAFDSEWVLLEDPETTESLEILKGTVLCHSKDRKEVYQKAMELRPKHSAFLFTGRIETKLAL